MRPCYREVQVLWDAEEEDVENLEPSVRVLDIFYFEEKDLQEQ